MKERIRHKPIPPQMPQSQPVNKECNWHLALYQRNLKQNAILGNFKLVMPLLLLLLFIYLYCMDSLLILLPHMIPQESAIIYYLHT